MPTLKIRPGEAITIGDNITITVLRAGDEPQLAIDAPPDVEIELVELINQLTDNEQS